MSQKRPSLALPANANPKRRKPSTGPSHLRQTSFPPEGASVSTPASVSATTPRGYSRSPSVESSLAGTAANSLVNGVGGRKKRKRKTGDGLADDSRSMTGTSVRGGKAGSAVEAEAEDEEGEGEGDVEVSLEGGGKVMDDAAAKQERERLA
jgi:transcription initiation factor TFIID subunit 11